jgi:hypothetical protein
MRRLILLFACACVVSILAVTGVQAADGDAVIVTGPKSAASQATGSQPKFRTTTEKRNWLRTQLRQSVNNPWQVRQLQANVNRLTARQVNTLTDAILAQQLPENWQQEQQQQQQEQAQLERYRAQMLRQVLSDQMAWRRFNRVGYLPVITWLPQGTSFGASATISPDGRYVRTTANPFFSSIGPVYTYNLNTGETRLMPPQTPYPTYGSRSLGTPQENAAYRMGQMPPQHLPPPAPSAYPNVWYDGMRTRVGPRP